MQKGIFVSRALILAHKLLDLGGKMEIAAVFP